MKVVKENYETLIQIGLPTFILNHEKKWVFFLQEGWDVETGWNYSSEMTEIQQIQLYRFIKANTIESCLSNEIELKYNLKNKQQIEIKVVKHHSNNISFDFFINHQQLSKKLGINRFDMAYSDFDLDVFEVDTTKFPNYDRKKINTNAVSGFLGISKPINQFGTDRIVLYRCHCGSDYCGVISFALHKEDNSIIWKDISYEDDTENNEEIIIKELRFDSREYQLEFEQYLSKYCS